MKKVEQKSKGCRGLKGFFRRLWESLTALPNENTEHYDYIEKNGTPTVRPPQDRIDELHSIAWKHRMYFNLGSNG